VSDAVGTRQRSLLKPAFQVPQEVVLPIEVAEQMR
jgi:hypothetical protein